MSERVDSDNMIDSWALTPKDVGMFGKISSSQMHIFFSKTLISPGGVNLRSWSSTNPPGGVITVAKILFNSPGLETADGGVVI